MLNYVVEEDLQVVVVSQFDYITAQKENEIDWSKWFEYDKETRLLDACEANVVSKCNHKFRVILVEKKQEKIKIKKRKEYIYYAIVTRLNNPSDPSEIYEFYHQRQTIENFFKESKNPFNSSKMPSQKFRANKAYLNLITIAYNCFGIFKKTICQKSGRENLLVQLNQLIKHGAEITVTYDNIWTIKLNKKYKFKAHEIQISNSIRQKVTMNRCIQIILHKGNI